MNQKSENWVLGGLLVFFAGYTILRAWILPVTVDEASTAFNHVPRLVFDTLTYQHETNPNNHILNTILIKFFTGIFGWHHFVLRLPVLLGAMLYAWSSFHLVRKISNESWIRILSLTMLLGNPYLLEFFSLARGYGLAVGLMTFALWHTWLYLESNMAASLRMAFLFAGLSVYANFTLIIFFVPFVSLLLFCAWQLNPGIVPFWKNTRPSLITLVVFVLLWIAPLSRLSRDSEIVNWNALGTYFDSTQRSIRAAIHANAYLGNESDTMLTWLAFIGAFIMAAVALWRWRQHGFRLSQDPRVLLIFLLIGAGVANVAQVHLTKTPYLQSRLALFYWPLFALSIGAAAAWISEVYGRKKSWILVGPIFFLLLVNNLRTLNLHSSFEWFHDSDTFTVLDYLKKVHQAEGRTEPFSFETEWFMQNSFMYHLEKGDYGYAKYVQQVPFHGRRPPQKDTDYYYAVNFDTVKDVIDAYDIVLPVPNSTYILLRRKK